MVVFQDFPIIEHYEYVSPADYHTNSACESSATCSLLEWWIYKSYNQKVILDHQKVFELVREVYKKRNPDAGKGLPVGETAEFMIKKGWLPSDTIIRRISKYNEWAILEALEYSPIIVSHRVTDGWEPPNLMGMVVDNKKFKKISGSHATLLIGTAIAMIPDEKQYYMCLNSWGPHKPSNGIIAVPRFDFMYYILSKPVQLIMGKKWENGFNGWKEIVDDKKTNP